MFSVCRSSFWFAVLTRAYPYIMVYLLSVILKFNWFYYTPESLRCQPHESKKSWIYRLFIIAKMIWQLFDSACTKKSCTGEHHRLVGSETPLSCIKKNQPKFKRRGGGYIVTTPWPFPSILRSKTLATDRVLNKGTWKNCDTMKSGWVKLAKPIDNFLTQSRVKERNEKHQKRKKERRD